MSRFYQIKTSITNYNIPYHVGILDNETKLVYHNSGNQKNNYGGSIICEPLDEFIANRKFYELQPLPICYQNLNDFNRSNINTRYDALLFNCEDYVQQICYNKNGSKIKNLVLFYTSLFCI